MTIARRASIYRANFLELVRLQVTAADHPAKGGGAGKPDIVDDDMTGNLGPYREIAAIIARFAQADREYASPRTAGWTAGYQSPSQFSREYSRLYGLSPLRDIGGLQLALAGE